MKKVVIDIEIPDIELFYIILEELIICVWTMDFW